MKSRRDIRASVACPGNNNCNWDNTNNNNHPVAAGRVVRAGACKKPQGLDGLNWSHIMARTEHLIIFQKVYDLIREIYRDCNNFPKSQRFILGQRIENTTVNILEGIIAANSEENKSGSLRKVSVEIEKLRIFLRLSKDLAFLAFKRYEILSAKVDEIGRMCGGWIKAV